MGPAETLVFQEQYLEPEQTCVFLCRCGQQWDTETSGTCPEMFILMAYLGKKKKKTKTCEDMLSLGQVYSCDTMAPACLRLHCCVVYK